MFHYVVVPLTALGNPKKRIQNKNANSNEPMEPAVTVTRSSTSGLPAAPVEGVGCVVVELVEEDDGVALGVADDVEV